VLKRRGCSSAKYSLPFGTVTIRLIPARFARNQSNDGFRGARMARFPRDRRGLLSRRDAVESGAIAAQPIDPLAHILCGATHEAAMLIAHTEDEAAARDQAKDAVTRLLSGLRAD